MNRDEELMDQIKLLALKNNVDVDTIKSTIELFARKDEERVIRERVVNNQQFVGRYYKGIKRPHFGMFPEITRFYKVISARTSISDRVHCLIFDEKPTYWFHYQHYAIPRAGNYYLGEYDFDSFFIGDVPIKDLSSLAIEITEAEWKQAAQKYLDEMLNMQWYEDHYRYGGKLPSDPDWRITVDD